MWNGAACPFPAKLRFILQLQKDSFVFVSAGCGSYVQEYGLSFIECGRLGLVERSAEAEEITISYFSRLAIILGYIIRKLIKTARIGMSQLFGYR